jgi:hypothetical protein
MLTASVRGASGPTHRDPYTGVRCARSALWSTAG